MPYVSFVSVMSKIEIKTQNIIDTCHIYICPQGGEVVFFSIWKILAMHLHSHIKWIITEGLWNFWKSNIQNAIDSGKMLKILMS